MIAEDRHAWINPSRTVSMYEIFEHTADIGLRVRTDSLNGLMEDAAAGLFSIIVANLSDVKHVETRRFQLPGAEPDLLLFDWLTELLYAFDAEQFVLAASEVQVDGAGLKAECHGERLDAARHRMEHEVKAITYHGLAVQRGGDSWLAEVIVDI